MLLTLIGRLLLVAFPKRFRERLGRPLLQTLLADSRTASGRLAFGRFATGAVEVVRAGVAERVAVSRAGPGAAPRRSSLEGIGQDLRYGLRRLLRARGFTIAAVLTFGALEIRIPPRGLLFDRISRDTSSPVSR